MNITKTFFIAIAALTLVVTGFTPKASADQKIWLTSTLSAQGLKDFTAVTKALGEHFEDVYLSEKLNLKYGNIKSIGFNCQVDAATKKISACGWMFANVMETINTSTGLQETQVMDTFTCPVSIQGSMDQFFSHFDHDDYWIAALPGNNPSFDIQMHRCF